MLVDFNHKNIYPYPWQTTAPCNKADYTSQEMEKKKGKSQIKA